MVQYGDYECPYTRLSRHSVHQLLREFWTMHEYLFEHQKALEDADLRRYAVELGLDSDRFARARTSPEVANRVDRDLASGERSGVTGTPTFSVNGVRRDGGYDLQSLRSAMVAHMDGRAKAH